MRHWRVALFALVAFAQAAVPASMIWKRENTLKHGRVWKLRTAPVDPVDAFRGRYVALDFDIGRSDAVEKWVETESGGPVFMVLKEDAEGFATIDRLTRDSRPGYGSVIQAEQRWSRIVLPFDKYWVTERDAKAAEAAYRLQSTREKRNAYVTIRVRDGDCGIEQLYLDGIPLAEYLQSHPSK